MSQSTKMNSMMSDMDFSALDRELARMAAETPAVPADFHAGWVQAVREDAARMKTESPKKEKESSRKQWRYLASAAAVFVLVIGGVLLARNQNAKPASGGSSGTAVTQQADRNEAEPVPIEEEYQAASSTVYNETYEASWEMEAMEDSMAYEDVEEEAPAAMMVAASEPFRAEETDADMEEAQAAGSSFFKTGSQAKTANADAAALGGVPAEPSAEAGAAAMANAFAASASVTAEPAMAGSQDVSAADTAADTAAAKEGSSLPDDEKEEETAEEDHSGLQKVWSGILSATPWILGGVIVLLFIASVVLHFGKKKNG